ncbi:protein BCAP-like isoform X2 [Sander lucioperca]|nr:protein BCAP-like isoform X2 [Sander lucioperca]
MKPQKNTDTKAMEMEKLQRELNRAKLNEQRLMDQNTEQKKRLAKLVTADIALKKEEGEVTLLKKKIAYRDRHVEKLRKDLHNIKTELWDEKTSRANEKTKSEEIIELLTKESQEYQNNFSVEKTFREQKEKELEKLINTQTEKKDLILRVQKLRHQVQELTGNKYYALKKIEEQNQLLQNKETDMNLITEELIKLRSYAQCCKEEVEKLTPFKDRLETVQEQCERQLNELIRQKKQNYIYKKEIHLLSKEIGILTSKNEDLTILYKKLENNMEIVQQEKKTLTVHSKNQKKEAEKQRKLIENLESELNSCSELKTNFQNKEREVAKNNMARDMEIINVRNLISESDSQKRRLTVQIEGVRTEKKILTENFFKAQEEMGQMNKLIRKQHNKLKDKEREADSRSAELVMVKRKLDSLRYQLEKVREQLAETKMAQTLSVVSADKVHQLAENTLAKITAEKEKLEHEVQQYREQAVQQKRMLNLQDAEKATLEETVRENEGTVKSLRLKNKRLQLEHDIKVTILQRHLAISRRDRIRCKMPNLSSYLKLMYNQQRHTLLSMKTQDVQLLKKKNKEIEELKCKLARRPDDAIQKYQECLWDNRNLKEKVMASHGLLRAYEAKNKEVEEENKRLTDELRKLKLEHRYTHLPPISKLPQPVRFPLNSKRQSESEGKLKFAPLPPISNSLQCQGRQIRPPKRPAL